MQRQVYAEVGGFIPKCQINRGKRNACSGFGKFVPITFEEAAKIATGSVNKFSVTYNCNHTDEIELVR